MGVADKRPIPQWWLEAKFGIFIIGRLLVPATIDAANVYAKYSGTTTTACAPTTRPTNSMPTYGTNVTYAIRHAVPRRA